jgi:hypothetical protein
MAGELRGPMMRIIELQREYSATNTPLMRERGVLIRDLLPSAIRRIPMGSSMAVEGRDATGLKSKVPWVRVFDPQLSPRATEGWYVVYLFHEGGGGVTLSLNQATTTPVGGAFEPILPSLLEKRVQWARKQLVTPLVPVHSFTPGISIGEGDLASAYELGHVFGQSYGSDLPEELTLTKDLLTLLAILSCLYRINPDS